MVKNDELPDQDRPQESDAGTPRDVESKRIPLDRVVLEVLRRGFGVGRDTLKQTDEALRGASDSTFAKEAAGHMASQIGDLRQGIAKVIAKEVQKYLGRIDLASELRKALEGMSIEGTVKIKFRDSEEDKPK
jgi:hypothetical protein